ncbi:MAG: ABC transporter substrate-binding protein [Gammaproteobacteria bacterium]|nr:ABC transporter substrate-binding protein [Gammaproteobacteria bacterium]
MSLVQGKLFFLGLLMMALHVNVHAAQMEPVPQKIIREATDQLLERFRQEEMLIRTQPGKLYDLVVDVVVPTFDFWRMSRWVLGKYWRKASVKQRQRFVVEFQQMLVRTYSAALLEYKGQELVFLPMKGPSKRGEVTVRVEIEQAGAFPIPISYRLYQKDNEWKIFDVKIDEISMVSNYRTTFGSEIRKHGIDWLIRELAAKNGKKN